jgi:hypothetical protein
MNSIGSTKLRSLEFDQCEWLCLGLLLEHPANTGAAGSFRILRCRKFQISDLRSQILHFDRTSVFAIAETHAGSIYYAWAEQQYL